MSAETKNRVLAQLSPGVLELLLSGGRRKSFRTGDDVWRDGDNPAMACFPEHGIFARRDHGRDGAHIEVEACGIDGSLGLAETLAQSPSGFSCHALSPATAWLLPRDPLLRLLRVETMASAIFVELADASRRLAVNVACSLSHSTTARLADRILRFSALHGAGRLPLTQEACAAAFGVCRTTVTAVCADLEAQGCIAKGRGWVSIADPKALRKVACGCRAHHRS